VAGAVVFAGWLLPDPHPATPTTRTVASATWWRRRQRMAMVPFYTVAAGILHN
jgi:hypothetical protein